MAQARKHYLQLIFIVLECYSSQKMDRISCFIKIKQQNFRIQMLYMASFKLKSAKKNLVEKRPLSLTPTTRFCFVYTAVFAELLNKWQFSKTTSGK